MGKIAHVLASDIGCFHQERDDWIRRLSAGDPENRAAAAHELGRRMGGTVLDALLRAEMGEEDGEVRAAILLAMKTFKEGMPSN